MVFLNLENTHELHQFPTISNKEENAQTQEKRLKRIATLDFFRGFAIFFMTIYHVIMMIYDYHWIENFDNLLQLPLFVLALLGIATFFGTWHGFFLLISSIVNAYAVVGKAKRIENTHPILFKQLFTGVAIYFLGWFEQAFGYKGYFGNVIQGGSWKNFSFLKIALFKTQTLQSIGLCLIINGIILYFLTRKEGYDNYWRNMSFFTLLSISVLILTAYLRKWIIIYSIFNTELTDSLVPLTELAIANGSFKAWIMAITTGGLLPPFPFMVTSFAGSMIGLTLANPDIHKRTPLIGILIGFLLLVFGVILIIAGAPWTTIENFAALSTYFIRFGTQLMVIWFFLFLIEFRAKGEKFGNSSIVKFFRQWGIISLTIYVLQIFQYFPRAILHLLFHSPSGINFLQDNAIGKGAELNIVLVVIFTILWFYLVILLWGKVNYLGSFEWIIIKIQSTFSKAKERRLNPEIILNQVKWISFGQKDEDLAPKIFQADSYQTH